MAKRALSQPRSFQQFELPGFVLAETGLKPKKGATKAQTAAAIVFARRSHLSSGWWLADLLRFVDAHGDAWSDLADEIAEAFGVSVKRLKNIRAVAAMPLSRRRDDVPFGMHEEVAGLDQVDRDRMLERIATDNLTRSEVRQILRADKRRRVITTQAVLEGQYRIHYIDPPWPYDDHGQVTSGSEYARAESAYPTMPLSEIMQLPVLAHCPPNATVFVWATAPMLREAFHVIDAWGLEYKQNIVWDKVLSGGPPNYVVPKHEHLLICVRGLGLPDIPTGLPDSVQTIRRPDDFEHSEKPEEFRKIIDTHWPEGGRSEWFPRRTPPKPWVALMGNDERLAADA